MYYTKNKLVVFCGPSGAGKSTIARNVMNTIPVFELSVSATTRSPRKGEEHGKHYYFISQDEFEQKINDEAFLEYEQVYEGLYYGTPFSEMERIWANNHVPFLDLDVKGAANLKEKYGKNGLFVFIHPGTIDILAERLKNRGTEDSRSIEKRIRRASFELEYANKFDYVLKNDVLERADKEIVEVVKQFLEKDIS
jgi:guanylate kinase